MSQIKIKMPYSTIIEAIKVLNETLSLGGDSNEDVRAAAREKIKELIEAIK